MKRWVFALLIVSLSVIAQLSQQWSGYLVLMFPLGWYLGRLYLKWVTLTDQHSVVRVIVREQALETIAVDGTSVTGVLKGQQWLSHWLIILRYCDNDGRIHNLPIFSDATGQADFHRLLVALKIMN